LVNLWLGLGRRQFMIFSRRIAKEAALQIPRDVLVLVLSVLRTAVLLTVTAHYSITVLRRPKVTIEH